MNSEEDYSGKSVSLEKMKKWGVISEAYVHPISPNIPKRELIIDQQLIFRNWVGNYSRAIAFRKDKTTLQKVNSLEATCRELRNRVRKLETLTNSRMESSKADVVYQLFKNELENKYVGKIVAIDVDSEKIVGIGDSILEAYKEAKKHSSKATFAYRRVGFSYVHRI